MKTQSKTPKNKKKNNTRIFNFSSYPLAGVSLRAIFSIFDSRASLSVTVWILLSLRTIGFAMTSGLFSKVWLSLALPAVIRQSNKERKKEKLENWVRRVSETTRERET